MASLTSEASSSPSSLPSSSLNPQRIKSLKTFLASEEMISIVPNFNYKTPMNFLLSQDSIGPLHAGQDATVPLWVALYLRKRNLCRLRCPPWMSVEHLKKVLAHERDATEENFSSDLPFRYMEVARAVLSAVGAGRSAVHAASGMDEEIEQAEVVRVLLEDISMVRMDKIRRNIHELSANVMGGSTRSSMSKPMPILDVSGIGSMEIATVKPYLETAFEHHLKLARAGREGTGNSQKNEEERTTSRRMVSTRRRERENTIEQNIEKEDEDNDEHENANADANANANEELVEGDTGDVNDSTAVSRRTVRRYRS